MFRWPRPIALMIVFAGYCTFAGGHAYAQAVNEEQELVDRVNRSIDRGVSFLKRNYSKQTHWESFWLNTLGEMDGGVTSLGTLALLNCGEPVNDPVVNSALTYLRSLPPNKTYVVGLQTMVFAEARQARDLGLIQRNVDWLIKNASRQNGQIVGWSYPLDQSTRPDASNTQYALLGLYAAKQAGAKIPQDVWKQIRDLYINSEMKVDEDSSYWPYVAGANSPSFTMTVAGVSGLLIAGQGLDQSEQKLDPQTGIAANCGIYEENQPMNRGMNWIGQNFSFDAAVNIKSAYYNIYGIERVGRLSGQRFIGRIDWYREGCELLVRTQDPRGGFWASNRQVGVPVDNIRVLATSFSLLFLSKGRTPILISKLAYGDHTFNKSNLLVERPEAGGAIGWNRKHNDARHLTEFSSRELFQGLPLGWQVYDPRRREYKTKDEILNEVGVLVQSPILYLNGHRAPKLAGQHKEILKRYIEEGGFVVAEACCGKDEFAQGFKDLMEELFPDNKLAPLPAEHPIWRSFYAVPPGTFPKVLGMERGCRTVVILSEEPLAGYWEEEKYMPKGRGVSKNRGEEAYRLAGNIIAYATGMEPPKQRLTRTQIVDASREDRSPPRGFIKPAQLRLPDENFPAPAAMRNVMGYLRDKARIDVVLDTEPIRPNDDELFKYKFVYMHGRKAFNLSDAELNNIKANLSSGGLLFADACCGSPAFDRSFREMVKQLYPDAELQPIPTDDELYSPAISGVAIRNVKRREKTDGVGDDGGFLTAPPALEGVKIDGRWAIIYSKYDIGCALEGHKATDCLGHNRESALQLTAAAILYALKR